MTQIKNKQTGETLTGEKTLSTDTKFGFKISGTTGDGNLLKIAEWEIIPPPLPTALGAVVKNSRGELFVRGGALGTFPWVIVGKNSWTNSVSILDDSPVTILSEGVTL